MTKTFTVLLSLTATLLASGSRLHTAEKKPNIIFIFSDDHAQHAISAYGSKVNTTPNIDRLATGEARFTHSFVTKEKDPAVAAKFTELKAEIVRLQKEYKDEGQFADSKTLPKNSSYSPSEVKEPSGTKTVTESVALSEAR